ncbi:hypothetical protein ACIOK4_42110 [Streptomyces bottropensis]|uniref:hypothetical protein n=1 Tax=Streptomyces bottropensis TaxID=42235 RepID=UPI0037B5EF02
MSGESVDPTAGPISSPDNKRPLREGPAWDCFYPTADGGLSLDRSGTLAILPFPRHPNVGVEALTFTFTAAPSFLELEEQGETLRAMHARRAMAQGEDTLARSFAKDTRMWPGRRGHGARWEEAVATALAGTWIAPLQTGRTLPGTAADALRADARLVHRQLTPMWHRKVSGQRLWSLEATFGDGMTAYDVLTGGPDPFEVLFGELPDDPRITAVLTQLTPLERAVALAYAGPRMPTWTEAAATAAALVPTEFVGENLVKLGERVRTKLKRLGAEQQRRREQRDGLPPSPRTVRSER